MAGPSAAFEKLAAERPDSPEYLGYLGALAARRGDRPEAKRVSDSLASMKVPYLRGAHTYWRARIAATLGEPERAVALLRKCFQGAGVRP
jgi:predicted Zn-dependent protease